MERRDDDVDGNGLPFEGEEESEDYVQEQAEVSCVHAIPGS